MSAFNTTERLNRSSAFKIRLATEIAKQYEISWDRAWQAVNSLAYIASYFDEMSTSPSGMPQYLLKCSTTRPGAYTAHKVILEKGTGTLSLLKDDYLWGIGPDLEL